MKTFLFFFLSVLSIQGFAQRIDTIDLVNHLGTIYPVKDKVTLSNGEFKQLIGSNKMAGYHLRKARILKGGQIATFTLSSIVLIAAFISEDDVYFYGLLGASAILTGLSYAIFDEPYNRQMLLAIKKYNEGIKASAVSPPER